MQKQSNATLWSIITLIVLIGGTIVANILGFQANTDTGNIANDTFNDANFFFPATYVFTTIWPVIYAGIIGWAIYQATPAQRNNPRFRAAAPWLMVNILLNGLWVWVFGMEAFVSTLPIMAALIYTGVMAYSKLRIGQEPVGRWERILQIPISIYLAWLTVAAVANIASALIAVDWNGFGISYEVWGLVMLLVGAGLAVFLYRTFYRDVVFLLVYLYAYIGIIVRYSDVPLILAGAAIGALIVGGLAAFHFISGRGQPALKAA
jgi:hypothetical protein